MVVVGFVGVGVVGGNGSVVGENRIQNYGRFVLSSRFISRANHRFVNRCSSRGRSGMKSSICMQIVDEKKLLDTRAKEIFMPALSSTMTEGKIVQWLKAPGDRVEAGDIVMVVESDKADMDVESFEAGYLASILVAEGDMAAVGSTVALIAETEEEIASIQECGLDCIVSGSGSRHDGTTAVQTTEHPIAEKAPAPAASSVPKPNLAELFMPALSSTMTEGKVVQWTKNEGGRIEQGDIVMVVESDKADMDVESFEEGYLAHIKTQEGESCPVGDAVGYIAASEAEIPAVKAWALQQSSTAAPAPSAASAPAVAAPSASAAPISAAAPRAVVNTGRIVASPYAKKLAAENGVDLKTVQGTGPSGRIVAKDVTSAATGNGATAPAAVAAAAAPTRTDGKIVATPDAVKVAKKEGIKLETVTGTGNFGRITAEDVLKAAGKAPAPKKVASSASSESAPAAAPKAAVELPSGSVTMNAMQKAVAKNMTQTLSVPIFRVSYAIKTTALDALYAKTKAKGVTLSSLLAKAVALTLEKHPIMNASYAPDAIVYNERINIAMAVAMPDGGLVTPVLANANTEDLYSLSRSWKDLVKRTMEKKLSPQEYSSGTFYISNLGMFGVESFDAVLPVGAGSILAIAGSKPRMSVGSNGLPNIEKEMIVNITCDHRIIYGAQAAEFLRDLAGLLENNVGDLLL
eukprot:CAMPEP_0182445966 /NCGR_PEP_ID=MMETSP1172-20130603/3899_1 /TAXON_ID=708627 /ORGANISM="Timspurckia oligopyrenoides, Strain CCMP3278" /LENGTH=689 /DNA_ID=CAMNT_0024641815 /DNA_START=1 /DNA_END=2070 /DNA_ORIENTATION=-